MGNGRHAGEEIHGLIDLHLQDLADVFALPRHRQGFGVEARAMADLTRHFDVWQKAHLDGAHALAFTARATAFAGVEGETRRAIATRFGLQGVGEQFAHRVPKTDVGGGARTRGFADGCLVHFEHTVQGLVAVNRVAAHPARQLARVHGLTACARAALPHGLRHVGEQDVAGQGGFARTRYTRDHHQAAQGHAGVHALQVVHARTLHAQGLGAGFYRTSRLQGVSHGVQQITARHRFGHRRDIGHRTLRHHTTTAHTGARADVDDVVGAADRVLVMLHHHQGVALFAQQLQSVEQQVVVAGVQTDGRLVEHVAHAL